MGSLWIFVILYEEMKFGYLHVQNYGRVNEKLLLKGYSIQRIVKIIQLALSDIGNIKKISCVFVMLHYSKGLGPKGYPVLWKREDLGSYDFLHTHTRALAPSCWVGSWVLVLVRCTLLHKIISFVTLQIRNKTQICLLEFLNMIEIEETVS